MPRLSDFHRALPAREVPAIRTRGISSQQDIYFNLLLVGFLYFMQAHVYFYALRLWIILQSKGGLNGQSQSICFGRQTEPA
jgi:hypothetical protein